MRRFLLPIALVFLLCAAPAAAHELRYDVDRRTDALSVTLATDDGDVFSFEEYAIYRGNEAEPFQVGKTDARGRIAFLPDGAGRWRVKAFSQSGHGVDFSLETDAAGTVVALERPLIDRYARLITGVSLLFGLFGLLQLLLARRKTARG